MFKQLTLTGLPSTGTNGALALKDTNYKLKHDASHGSQCYKGYPGLAFTADKIANYIPPCRIYVEPLAGLARVAKYIKQTKRF